MLHFHYICNHYWLLASSTTCYIFSHHRPMIKSCVPESQTCQLGWRLITQLPRSSQVSQFVSRCMPPLLPFIAKTTSVARFQVGVWERKTSTTWLSTIPTDTNMQWHPTQSYFLMCWHQCKPTLHLPYPWMWRVKAFDCWQSTLRVAIYYNRIVPKSHFVCCKDGM